MDIVKIEWLDARSVDGWSQVQDFNDELSLIKTCGYLCKENDVAYFVSACAAIDEVDGSSFACTIVIPKKMVTHFEVLKD